MSHKSPTVKTSTDLVLQIKFNLRRRTYYLSRCFISAICNFLVPVSHKLWLNLIIDYIKLSPKFNHRLYLQKNSMWVSGVSPWQTRDSLCKVKPVYTDLRKKGYKVFSSRVNINSVNIKVTEWCCLSTL